MASGFGLRHALPATRARVVPQARTVLTRATIAEPVVVKREGTSHAMRQKLLSISRNNASAQSAKTANATRNTPSPPARAAGSRLRR